MIWNMYGYLCIKFHDDISIFWSRQYLKCHTLNSHNLTTNKNIHIPITYYDMKYLCLYVYQFSWGYLNIWILNILEKHDKIICIWWLIIEHTILLWEVNTQGETTPLNVYTVQNPRRRVVSVKTSQMRTICTLIWRESWARILKDFQMTVGLKVWVQGCQISLKIFSM